MSIWPRNKPLNQPSHYGRIGAQRAVAEAQHARKAKTIKHGARATVR